jgi:predicted 3-demethylubiquinone-9 3-methyltransferase (glyoxalase superfamily)/uncharacterized protein YndB with AHSA1/START domain
MANKQKITPCLWFDQQAEEAADFYVSLFPDSEITGALRHGDTTVLVHFSLGGQQFSALNGGPHFQINPSISLFAMCSTEAETDAVWQALAEGGAVLMPLDKYEWSAKYGWIQDRYGMTWQISLGDKKETGGKKFSPSLLFTGPQAGRAEAALRFYTEVFQPSAVDGILHYVEGEAGKPGMVKHAQFRLLGETFMVMDNPMGQDFTFNEGVSFVVDCQGQAEVDYFWEKLTAQGGEESQCGWLKDPFGVSWQIVPEALPKLLADPDPARAQTAMAALLRMKKIEIDKLEQMPEKAHLTVKTIVNAPAEQVWQLWTKPEHVMRWNHASEDWYCPKAENDLQPGGDFCFGMAAKDGSFSFDFKGTYDEVDAHELIAYTLDDGRTVEIRFVPNGGQTAITQVFEAENTHPLDLQQAGWQSIMDNFKKYAEG